ncbi:MAG: tRNA threonylcarbamoyladenosine biosynthesis protein TsaB, partial [Nitrospiria bacterium]
ETPLVLVPTMEAMAAPFPFSRGVIAPVLDARRGEIYWSLFDNRDGVLNRLLPDGVAPPEEALAEIGRLLNEIGDAVSKEVLFVGEGGIPYRKQIVEGMSGKARFPTRTLQFPSAANVAERGLQRLARGETTPPDQAIPLYLRASQAELKWKAGRGKIRSSTMGESPESGG